MSLYSSDIGPGAYSGRSEPSDKKRGGAGGGGGFSPDLKDHRGQMSKSLFLFFIAEISFTS